jgi:hypothetical protein
MVLLRQEQAAVAAVLIQAALRVLGVQAAAVLVKETQPHPVTQDLLILVLAVAAVAI